MKHFESELNLRYIETMSDNNRDFIRSPFSRNRPWRHIRLRTDSRGLGHFLLQTRVCRDKTFVTTKMMLMAAPANGTFVALLFILGSLLLLGNPVSLIKKKKCFSNL